MYTTSKTWKHLLNGEFEPTQHAIFKVPNNSIIMVFQHLDKLVQSYFIILAHIPTYSQNVGSHVSKVDKLLIENLPKNSNM